MQSKGKTLMWKWLCALTAMWVVTAPLQAQGNRGLAPSLGASSRSPVNGKAATASPQDAVINEVRWDRKMNAQLPLDATFKDEAGRTVQLKQYFKDKPVVLMLIFYNCTMLCSEVMNGSLRTMKDSKLGFQIGRDYEVVTVSIDPTETPELAAAKKKTYLKELGNPAGGEQGWHLLVGDKTNIDKVANAVGYHYSYDKVTTDYAHPGGIVVSTPHGKVSSYFYGIDYPAEQVRLGLVDASNNKIGSLVEKAVLFLCFHYDPDQGKYSLEIMKVVRMAAIATILGIVFGIVMMRRAEARAMQRRLKKKQASAVEAQPV